MKITAIRPFPVRLGNRLQLLVKVETDQGIFGWGESGLSTREAAVLGALDHFERFLVGRDPLRAGSLWQEMYRSQYFEGGRVLAAAISAIDIALYDIKGKALDVPVYELLGGKQRDVVPTFASLRGDTAEQMADVGALLLEHGWTCLRVISLGGSPADTPDVFDPRRSLAETSEKMTALRRAFGPEVTLGIDYHHRLSVAEAASFCQRMPVGTLDFIEEPIRDESPEAYATLRTLTSVPFAIGEEFASKWQFLPYIERGLTQYARLDVCNVGGFTEAMKVAGWCEAHYIDLMPHNPLGPVCTAASVHLAAAIPNFSWLECRETPGESVDAPDSTIFANSPNLDGAVYPVSEAPGLGLEIDEEALASAVTDDWHEAPHFRRPDGSYTNW